MLSDDIVLKYYERNEDKKMKEFEGKINDTELEGVVGGTIAGVVGDAGVFNNHSAFLEGSKTMTGKDTLPFSCKNPGCGQMFYIPSKGASKVKCPFCHKTYEIMG